MTKHNREFKVGDWVVLENEHSLAHILQTDGRWSIIKWLDDNTESNVRLDFLRHAYKEVERTEKHIQLAETELYRQQQEVERLKTENLAMQVEIDLLKESLNNALRARDEARQSMPIKYAE